jgi:putative phosphoesterase
MKLLVLSDSHAALAFMRLCVESVKPDVVIHLGDHYDDAKAMEEEYPHIRFYCVPGNCDHYRVPANVPQTLVEKIAGVTMYMTHGHLHRVKSGEGALIAAARSRGAQIALYGHTHRGLCERLEDGLWLMNPGSCGYYGGSAGMIVIEKQKITCCRLLRQEDLEEMK